MDSILLVGALLVGVGIAVVIAGFAGRGRVRDAELASLIGLPMDQRELLLDESEEQGAVLSGTLDLADRAIRTWDPRSILRDRIVQADLAIRPAELVVLTAAAAVTVGSIGILLTNRWWSVLVPFLAAPLVVNYVLKVLAERRSKRFAAQLPDALLLVASSLQAGHSFLRALQIMADEYDAPLSDEFRRVVNETELGSPMVDSLERMSNRMALRDLDWMVQAIRIQQAVGGQLADLLTTLAEFMRARDELRREVNALTAEGRVSAWVLGALPVVLFVAIQAINPGYLTPMLRGWGIFWLALTATSIMAGIAIILRMVRSVEV